MEATRRVLLLTDLVDSTRITSELGDAAAAALWTSHDDRIRRLIAQHNGREIDKSDGFLLVFDTVPDADAFQLAYHRALAAFAPPLRARVGVHAGQVLLRMASPEQVERGAKPVEVDGVVKPLAARLMALAAGGQTLGTPDVAALSPGARPIGHYSLKGISEPVEVWALAGGTFERPPDGDKARRVVLSAGSWVAVAEIGHGLGAETDHIVGRTDELVRLDGLVRRGARLLTLVGPGGVGKTRLARHWALEHLADVPGGTYFVDLVSAIDEAGLLRAVAKELEVQLGAEPATQLGAALSARGRALLILDNFEQIAAQAHHVGAWLAAAPELVVLATSRQRLGLGGEHVVDVDPLPLPPPADAPSIALFVRRAQQLRPDFVLDAATLPVVIDIVRRLDGLPLALELAAARMRALGLTQLRDRLNKSLGMLKQEARSDRQRTLQATIDWSWQLLDPKAQVAFREASVFRGPFDLEAAEAVFTGGEDEALDLIQELVDKSLVRSEDAGEGQTRYRLLESIRAFGEDMLARSGDETSVRDRHARWFFSVAARLGAQLLGGPRLADALPNVRAAILHARTDADLAREGMPLVYQIPHWTYSEGVELVEIARPFLEGVQLGRLALFEGQLQHKAGDPTGAVRLDERACEIFRAAGDLRWVAEGLLARGMHLWWAADPACEAVFEEAIRAAEADGDEGVLTRARAYRAMVWMHQGRFADVEGPYRERVAYAERAAPDDLALALNGLGILLLFSGRVEECVRVFERAVSICQRESRQDLETKVLGNLGGALATFDPLRAIPFVESAAQLARQRGNVREVQSLSAVLASAYVLAGRMDDFVALPIPPVQDRRYGAMQDLLVATRCAFQDDPRRAREVLDAAFVDLRALGETEAHWVKEHAIGVAFVALAEARSGARTLEDAITEARAQTARDIGEPALQAIEREIERTRAWDSGVVGG